jgi:hypothetical protein
MKNKNIIVIMPIVRLNDWLFRISVSKNQYIMVFAINIINDSFMIRFFTEEEHAVAFIEECSEGKHSDTL